MEGFKYLPSNIVNKGEVFNYMMPDINTVGYYHNDIAIVAVTLTTHMTHQDLFNRLAYLLMKKKYILPNLAFMGDWDSRVDEIFDSIIETRHESNIA